MSTLINLYPPILNTYQPAFVNTSSIKIYFTLSELNNRSEIANAQITIINQNTNLTALDSTKYPSEIMLKEIQSDSKGYYITIAATDIQGGSFIIDNYYNVQIRFTSTSATSIALTTPQRLDSWLATNLDKFSEWSRVTIIKAISQPTMSVAGFNIVDGHIAWSMANNSLIGTLTFASADETEKLNSYQIILKDDDNNILTDSGKLYTNNYNNPNSFIYNFKYGFEVGESYSFTINYETNNLYTSYTTISFDVVQDSPDDVTFSIAATLDESNSRIGINIKRGEDENFYTGKIIIRRTSSESDFTIWEDMDVVNLTNITKYKYTWYDMTIKSGVWYNYAIQEATSGGVRKGIKILKKPLMTIFEDMFLSVKDKQLKIQFNPTINSFKRNISETKIETIGSKYPFIRRNGAINYAEFPISGLISFQMDEDQIFVKKEDLYLNKTLMKRYDKYNTTEDIEDWPITDMNDFVYEKLFRDEVIKFLYDGEVKLFRSPTEGNYLIRMTDVSFTPNQTLGRMIWNFSATATEVDEDIVDNYEKYGIIAERG